MSVTAEIVAGIDLTRRVRGEIKSHEVGEERDLEESSEDASDG